MNASQSKPSQSKQGRTPTRVRARAEGPIPRSMGLTFQFIRREYADDCSALELDKRFRSDEAFEASKGFVEPGRRGAYGKRITAYERAERDPSFATQHRYGVVAGTPTGIIHFASLMYAHLRCAARDAGSRANHLKEARETARKLRAMADAACKLVESAETSGIMEELKDRPPLNRAQKKVHGDVALKPLFEAYRKS